jgi:hypothetical protein
MFRTFFAFVLLGVASCSSERMHVLHGETLRLSLASPTVDLPVALRLISIERDGATTIERVKSRERLQANPGEFFGPDTGLRLLSASFETQTAEINYRWCEAK